MLEKLTDEGSRGDRHDRGNFKVAIVQDDGGVEVVGRTAALHHAVMPLFGLEESTFAVLVAQRIRHGRHGHWHAESTAKNREIGGQAHRSVLGALFLRVEQVRDLKEEWLDFEVANGCQGNADERPEDDLVDSVGPQEDAAERHESKKGDYCN